MASTGAVEAGKAFVKVSAKSDGIEKFFAKLGKQAKELGAGIFKIGAAGTGIGAAVLGPIAALTSYAEAAGSAATDMAGRLNTTTETITALGYAAGLAGGSLEDVEANLGKMQKAITEGALAGDEFLTGLLGKNVDQQLDALADKIAGVENPTLQSALAMEFFGKSGRKMLPFLKDGAAGLQRMREEAIRTGAVIGKDEAENADRFGDAISKIGTVVKSTGRALGAGIIGATVGQLEQYTEKAIDLGVTIRTWIASNGQAFQSVALVAAGVAAAGVAVMTLGAAVAGVGAVLAGMATVAGAVSAALAAWPLVLIVTGVAALTAGLAIAVSETETFQTLVNGLGQTFNTTWTGIKNAIAGGDIGLAMRIAGAGLKSALEDVLSPLRTAWVEFKFFFIDIWNAIQTAAEMAFDGIVWAAKTQINSVINTLNLLIGGINLANDAIAKFERWATGGISQRRPGEIPKIGNLDTTDPFAGSLDKANKRDRETAAAKAAALDAAGKKDPAAAAELERLNREAAAAKEKAEFDAMVAEAVKAEEQFLQAATDSGVALSKGASEVKGAFANVLDARTFAFGDKSGVEKNTKLTADGVQELVELANRGGGLRFGA